MRFRWRKLSFPAEFRTEDQQLEKASPAGRDYRCFSDRHPGYVTRRYCNRIA
jgi:hypothetical protein